MPRRTLRVSRMVRDAVSRLTRLFDSACALVVMLAAFTVVNRGHMPEGLDEFLSARVSVRNVVLLASFACIWYACFAMFGLYRQWPRVPAASTAFSPRRIVAACTLATGVLSLFTFASNSGAFSWRVILWFWLVGVVAELIGRAAIAGAAKYIERQARQVRRAVIVGSGPRAQTLWQNILGREPKDTDVLGFVDTRPRHEVPDDIAPHMIGTLDDLEQLLCRQHIDQVFIALPVKSCYAAIQSVLDTCERVGVEATYFSDIFSSALARPAHDEEDELPAVHYQLVAGRPSPARQAGNRHRWRRRRPDRAGARSAGVRRARQAHGARARAVHPVALRPQPAPVPDVQVPDDGGGGRADAGRARDRETRRRARSSRFAQTRGSRESAGSCASSRSTSCRS